jgi:hypothetical protein
VSQVDTIAAVITALATVVAVLIALLDRTKRP